MNIMANFRGWLFIVMKSGKVQVKFTYNRPRRPRERVEVQFYTFFNLGAKWGGWSKPPPTDLPSGKTRYPLYRRLGGSQGRSGQVRKISPPPGFDPQTVEFLRKLRYPGPPSNQERKKFWQSGHVSMLYFVKITSTDVTWFCKCRRMRMNTLHNITYAHEHAPKYNVCA
jgi:hypothetical protein